MSREWGLVTVDIDGTLTLVHGWLAIAREVGRLAEFERTQARFLEGGIGEDEHLANLLQIARGRTVEEVLDAVASTPRLRHIAEGVRRLRAAGARVALLTHNPGFIADWYAREFGFQDSEGVDCPVPGGRIEPPAKIRADKPAGLARLAARASVPYSDIAHVGDGWSDAELFPLVGGGLALNSPIPEVRAAADVVVSTKDFLDAVQALETLRPRR